MKMKRTVSMLDVDTTAATHRAEILDLLRRLPTLVRETGTPAQRMKVLALS